MQSMKAIGKTISSMDKVLRLGESLMESKQLTLVIFTRARRMARESFSGKMGLTMKEILSMVSFKASGDTTLQI